MRKHSLGLVLLFLAAKPALSQTYRDSLGTIIPGVAPIIGCAIGGTGNCTGPVSASNPLPVAGTMSIGGFLPASVGLPLTATTSGATGTLPAGAVVIVTNVGATNGAYCALGNSSSTSGQYIAPNGGWFAFTVGSATQLTCLTSASTTFINMVGGSGFATGAGGGGGGSSITSWAGGALGAMANYGSSPGAVFVPGVNAFVTNIPAVAQSGIWTNRVVGNAGGIFDGATATSAPANALYMGMSVNGTLAGLTGSANGLKVDGSAVTQPVSAASLPLPAGAATAANQPIINVDGGGQVHVMNLPPTWQLGASSALVGGFNLVDSGGANKATVKPASTAPVSTDPALVVGLSPNSANLSAPINITNATTTQLVSASGTTAIYVSAYDIISVGIGSASFEYGSGVNCNTGTSQLTGPYPFNAYGGISKGSGTAPVLRIPAGNALCVLTTGASTQYSGSVTYQQF